MICRCWKCSVGCRIVGLIVVIFLLGDIVGVEKGYSWVWWILDGV